MNKNKILLLSYSLNRSDHRGVYQFTRSLVNAIKNNQYPLGLFTQVYNSSNTDTSSLLHYLKDPKKFFFKENNKYKIMIAYIKNKLSRENFKVIKKSNKNGNDFIDNFDFFINREILYYENNIDLLFNKSIYLKDINLKKFSKNDIIFTDSPLAFRATNHKVVQTVHDTIPIQEKRKYYQYFYKRLEACCYADKVLVISDYTRNCFLDHFPDMADRTEVVYQTIPVNEELIYLSMQPEIQEQVLKKYHLKSKQYMYYIGAVEERKNIHNLIQSYILATQSDKSIPLVISGSIDQAYSKKYNLDMYLVNNENYNFSKNNILKTDFVSDLEKLCLIRNSRAFLFPTLSEGFGIPVLEAQTLGIPVLTSNNTSLPEVVGSSALLLDNPLDTEEMIFNIKKLWEDNDLCVDLSVNGLINSQRFSKENFQVGINNFLTDF